MINVLIVEDDPMVAKFNRLYLESIAGFTVLGVARTAEEGWQLCQKLKIDLVLLDVYMNQKTGLELLQDFRKAGNLVDVIMISAANDKESIQIALHNGAVDYLIKPFSFERFQEALLNYRKKHQVMENLEQIRQEDLDLFLLKSGDKNQSLLNLPKGLTERTLASIAKEILAEKNPQFSTADLAIETGISRVSVRKYLNFLVDLNVLTVAVIYQEAGRPLHRFQLNPSKKGVLKTFTS